MLRRFLLFSHALISQDTLVDIITDCYVITDCNRYDCNVIIDCNREENLK